MQKGATRQGTRFFKLHGAGNDLLVVPSREMRAPKAAFVRRLAHRNLGVGCDQVVEVLSTNPLRIQIWNQDGTKAEMCANGSRTFLFLAARQAWLDRKAKRVPIEVSGGTYEGIQTKPGNYELSLGVPKIGEPDVLKLGAERIPYVPVRTGNPHAVIWMTGAKAWRPKEFDFLVTGPRIETHAKFPKKTNVEFLRRVAVKGKTAEADVEAWERGAGATLSCGSGAVAVAAVLKQRYGVGQVKVNMTEFTLRIRFEGDSALLSGPCALVAEGTYFGD